MNKCFRDPDSHYQLVVHYHIFRVSAVLFLPMFSDEQSVADLHAVVSGNVLLNAMYVY